jgi:HAD superfamily hydrolase (TIGR01509 family)
MNYHEAVLVSCTRQAPPTLREGTDVKFPRKPLAVIFDLDGLLLDTVPLYASAMVDAAGDVGHSVSHSYVLTLVGLLGHELRARLQADLGASFPVDAFLDAMATRVRQLVNRVAPLKMGAAELVQELAERGVPIGVATSLTRAEAEHHLAGAGLRSAFSAMAARDDVARGKPYPDVYQAAAALLRVDVRDCVALEDSFNGIRAAHAAGAMVIMVPDVLVPTAEIRTLCLRVARDLHDVKSLLAVVGSSGAGAATSDAAVGAG